MTLAVAGTIAVQGIFYASLIFIIGVSAFWPWWQSELGWSITAKSIALGLAVLPAQIAYWTGGKPSPGEQWAATILLWFVPPILIWRAWVLFKVQRRGAIGIPPDMRERLLAAGWRPPPDGPPA